MVSDMVCDQCKFFGMENDDVGLGWCDKTSKRIKSPDFNYCDEWKDYKEVDDDSIDSV